MTTRHKDEKMNPTRTLDSKACTDKVRKAGELAHRALRHYGEPTVSLAELRATLSQQLHGVSLSELIINEREAGW